MIAPANFSPNCKYFDQLLQTVKNKTTVLILVFKDFLQISIPPLISLVYAKGYHNFPLKNFRLTVPRNFLREPFSASLISGIENFYASERWLPRFSVEKFLSHSIKNPDYETFLQTSIPPLISIFYAKEGVSRVFVQIVLSHNTKKFRWGTLRFIGNLRVSKNFMLQRGGYHVLRQKFFSHSIKKFRWGTLRCFRKTRVPQNFMHEKGI